MSETTGTKRLSKVAKDLGVGINTLVDHLKKKGHSVEMNPNTKISDEQFGILMSEYSSEMKVKEEANKLGRDRIKPKDVVIEIARPKVHVIDEDDEEEGILVKSGLSNTPGKKVEPIVSAPVAKEIPKDVPVEIPKEIPKETPPPAPKIVEKATEPIVEAAPVPTPKPAVKAEKTKAKEEKEEGMGLTVVGKFDLSSLDRPKSKSKKTEEKSTKKAEPKPEVKKTAKTEPKAEAKPETKHKEKVKEPVAKEKPHTTEKEIQKTKPEPEITPPLPAEVEEAKVTEPKYEKLEGLKVMGRIELKVDPPAKKAHPVASSDDPHGKRKRKRKQVNGPGNTHPGGGAHPHAGAGTGAHKPDPNKPVDPNRPRPQYNTNRGPAQGGTNQGTGNRYGSNTRGPGGPGQGSYNNRNAKPEVKTEISDKEIQDKLKATLARLNPGSKNPNIGSVRSKLRKQKRDFRANEREEAAVQEELDKNKLQVTEFVTANELAQMMNLSVTQIISACMSLGMMVSINQRLDAETIAIVAEEFGFEVEFVSAEMVEAVEEEIDDPESLLPRAPIVTVMGHVDHGKTSLLDYVRSANVVKGEAGGITQHIGAYNVQLENGKKITFLDTPGHEAFTAMRARGAKLTDIVIIVIAADDSVMPQTKEAISHAQAAGVPIIFALNKIDREAANPERIKEQLSAMNILVEDWGGKFQCQEISAKKGIGIAELLEKVLLEAEMLDLKANPNKRAIGNIIEATLDKGRGIVTTVMVQSGTMHVGDPLLAGTHSGRVRAMFDERGKKMTEAGPSTPVVVLGFDGAPQAGDKFLVPKNEQEAKEIANKRQKLQREQGIRTHKHITLDEIGRRLAIGSFKELKVIVKGDVDGSVEALSDSLIKLSSDEVQVTVIYKAVGQISESDVMLASASDAIIVGFQVRPSPQARKLAEAESIDIRLYSVIYNAIEEIKSAIEGMLSPKIEEKILGNAQIREVFKVTKVGTVAGCMVTDGKIIRNSKIRLIRDGVVVFSGQLSSLKRFKDDVKEVASGFDCGLTINNYNDIKEGDYVEAYEEVEVKRTLK
ncbi:MAG: translation initiation factor IF-2 [Bacteroidota bacterium]|nr:translation initiation factor IF-2 [Bacteroidota bacterium]